jgi:hypothetical protein
VTADEWIAAFAADLGVDPPTAELAEQLLKLAALAAHSSERRAAPLACWVAGMAGADTDQFLAAAERLSDADQA